MSTQKLLDEEKTDDPRTPGEPSHIVEPRSSDSLVPQGLWKDIQKVDGTLAECREEMAAAKDSPVLQAFVQARAIVTLRKLITSGMMSDVMALMNTPLGFRTDKPTKDGYSQDQIKEAVIVALLNGCRLIGNEFNVIAGNCYVTQAGIARQVREFPGLANLKMEAGVPSNSASGGALVPYHATWTVDGVPDAIHCTKTVQEDTRIPVRVNASMGIDAILGKAKRKMLAKILERISGTKLESVDDGVIEGEGTTITLVETPEDMEELARQDVSEFLSEVEGLEEVEAVSQAVKRYKDSPAYEKITELGKVRVQEILNKAREEARK